VKLSKANSNAFNWLELRTMLNDSSIQFANPILVSLSSSSLDSISIETHKVQRAMSTETNLMSQTGSKDTNSSLSAPPSLQSISETEAPPSQTIPEAIPTVTIDSSKSRTFAQVSPAATYARSVIPYASISSITAALHPSGLPLLFNQSSTTDSQAGRVSLFQSLSSESRLTQVSSSSNTVPEFLYQLTKMLTDDNRDIIEWAKGTFIVKSLPYESICAIVFSRGTILTILSYSTPAGRIEVHSPHKLESDVLKKYFRHSKFARYVWLVKRLKKEYDYCRKM
jgi:hypothetical protein